MTIAIVKQNKQIADGIYLLTLYAPMVSEASRPGQFLNVYLGGDDLILPRPISIAGAYGCEVTLIYADVGKGTRRMTFLSEGDDVRVLGPLGNGFDIDSLSTIHDEVACVGGGLGIPSMSYAARYCEHYACAQHRLREAVRCIRHCERSDEIQCTSIFGYRNEAWLPEPKGRDSRLRGNDKGSRENGYGNHWCDNVLQISENDKSVSGALGITGNVVDLLNIHEFTGKAPIILSCGPIPMLKAVQDFAETRNIKTKLSLEARMGCGYGACVGCAISIRDKGWIPGQARDDKRVGVELRRKVCVDGPVFDGDTIIWESLE